MTVGKLIKELSKYDRRKPVLFMKERRNDDITFAEELHKVEQKVLSKDYYEYEEFVAVVILNLKS